MPSPDLHALKSTLEQMCELMGSVVPCSPGPQPGLHHSWTDDNDGHMGYSNREDYDLNEQRGFEQQLDQYPRDAITRKVFADWLREHGDERTAGTNDNLARWIENMRTGGGRYDPDPEYGQSPATDRDWFEGNFGDTNEHGYSNYEQYPNPHNTGGLSRPPWAGELLPWADHRTPWAEEVTPSDYSAYAGPYYPPQQPPRPAPRPAPQGDPTYDTGYDPPDPNPPRGHGTGHKPFGHDEETGLWQMPYADVGGSMYPLGAWEDYRPGYPMWTSPEALTGESSVIARPAGHDTAETGEFDHGGGAPSWVHDHNELAHRERGMQGRGRSPLPSARYDDSRPGGIIHHPGELQQVQPQPSWWEWMFPGGHGPRTAVTGKPGFTTGPSGAKITGAPAKRGVPQDLSGMISDQMDRGWVPNSAYAMYASGGGRSGGVKRRPPVAPARHPRTRRSPWGQQQFRPIYSAYVEEGGYDHPGKHEYFPLGWDTAGTDTPGGFVPPPVPPDYGPDDPWGPVDDPDPFHGHVVHDDFARYADGGIVVSRPLNQTQLRMRHGNKMFVSMWVPDGNGHKHVGTVPYNPHQHGDYSTLPDASEFGTGSALPPSDEQPGGGRMGVSHEFSAYDADDDYSYRDDVDFPPVHPRPHDFAPLDDDYPEDRHTHPNMKIPVDPDEYAAYGPAEDDLFAQYVDLAAQLAQCGPESTNSYCSYHSGEPNYEATGDDPVQSGGNLALSGNSPTRDFWRNKTPYAYGRGSL